MDGTAANVIVAPYVVVHLILDAHELSAFTATQKLDFRELLLELDKDVGIYV